MSTRRRLLLIVGLACAMALSFLAGGFFDPGRLGASSAALTNGQKAAVMGGQLLLYDSNSSVYLPLIVR